MKMSVAVKDLKKGDVLTPTMRTVVAICRGIKTAAGRHEIVLRRPNGSEAISEFRSATMVTIERPEPKISVDIKTD